MNERQELPAGLIECDGIGIRFPQAKAWRPEATSWSIAAGSRTLLLGPSGCGKSTLALAVAGLIPRVLPAQMRGTLQLGQRNIGSLTQTEVSQDVSIVFQDPDAQLFTETVLDEVCFALENRLLPVPHIEERAWWALDALGLTDLHEIDPRQLSGGLRQRVAIACAVATDPRVLVLDEPTANLDPVARGELYRVLEQMPGAHDMAVMLIEHNVDDVLEYVDRIVAFDRSGCLLADGTVAEMFTTHIDTLLAADVWLPTGVQAHARLAHTPMKDFLPAHAPLEHDALVSMLRAVGECGGQLTPQRAAKTVPSQDAKPLIEVRNVTVRRGRRRRETKTVLHNVDFAVADGTFAAIVGVNGAGKSTLLHTLAGILSPSEGEVRVAGRKVKRRGRAPMGLVFQNPEHQFIEVTLREELRAAADPALGSQQRDERIDQMLKAFGLDEAAERHPSMLSGGQKRRLSVGTALIGGHRIIAFDEPTFGQDAGSAAEIMALLDDLREQGVTILIVTHDLQLVAEHADTIIVMRDGTVAAHGAVGEVIHSEAIDAAGLRLPPLCAATRELSADNGLAGVTNMSQLDQISTPTEVS